MLNFFVYLFFNYNINAGIVQTLFNIYLLIVFNAY
jgi:hypothetical protein